MGTSRQPQRTVEYNAKVLADLSRMSGSDEDRVRGAIENFALTNQADIKALQGKLKGLHRLRIGKWRVMLRLDRTVVHVILLENRGEAY